MTEAREKSKLLYILLRVRRNEKVAIFVIQDPRKHIFNKITYVTVAIDFHQKYPGKYINDNLGKENFAYRLTLLPILPNIYEDL